MGQGDANRGGASDGCAWGCLGIFALGLALLILGWDLVGRLCIFLVLASTLAQALRDRRFQWPAIHQALWRDDHPLGYWTLIAVTAALACASIWILVEEAALAGPRALT
jgi:hypothetical protein